MTKAEPKRLERFEEVLSVYGAAPERWPARERDSLKRLAASDAGAVRLLAETVALEKLMARAPAGEPGSGLKQRIVAAALAENSREARVVPLAAARKSRSSPGIGQGGWWPAAALAACFAIGVYLGVAGLGAGAIEQAFDYASVDGMSDDGEGPDLFGAAVDQEGLL